MPVSTKTKMDSFPFKTLLSAVRKLSAEEKQLLRQQLFFSDALSEMKDFETRMKKRKPPVKKTDEEIVNITTSIRRKKYADAKKMLH